MTDQEALGTTDRGCFSPLLPTEPGTFPKGTDTERRLLSGQGKEKTKNTSGVTHGVACRLWLQGAPGGRMRTTAQSWRAMSPPGKLISADVS